MFTKNDLKTGMVVECKNGFRYMVITETVNTPNGLENGVLISAYGWLPLSKYSNDLVYGSIEYCFGDGYSFNIEKVYKSDVYDLTVMLKNANEIIWEREDSVNWYTISVDTPILVRDYEDEDWIPAYFAKYAYGVVSVWEDGGTSFTKKQTEAWCYAKLYEGDK